MGQSPSSIGASPDLSDHRVEILSPIVASPKYDRRSSDAEVASVVDSVDEGHDSTSDLPDELLAHVFHFLGPGDRKTVSTVCRRWLRVDGESRHRLSLNASSDLLLSLPSLFTRFDSVEKLALRCDRKSPSVSDEALVLISVKCRRLTRLKLRGCRELTDSGITAFAENCKTLKKLSCGSCTFGTRGINAVINHCVNLEEISIKRLRGIHDCAEPVGAGAAAPNLRSICLKELINGQCFAPLLIGAKNLKTLKLIKCLGKWDDVLHTLGHRNNPKLVEIHLERILVSDVGISGIANCKGVESLHLVKIPECSDFGLSEIAENCKLLRKLHIDGERRHRIGDEGLVAIARQCVNLQELVLIGVNATHSSLALIASNCKSLERLAFCGTETIGDAEISCIAMKCESLRKFCIKNCPISDLGIESLALGCPNLVKIKVRKCKRVTNQITEWLKERRPSLAFNIDACQVDALEDGGAQESTVEFPSMFTQVNASSHVSSSRNDWSVLARAKIGFFASRNIVACTFRRWSYNDHTSSGSS